MFTLGGLDLLNQLHTIPLQRRQTMIDWLYTMQVEPQVDQSEVICKKTLKSQMATG